jgi:hypothetical protein
MKNKTSSSAPKSSPRPMSGASARAVRGNQAKFDRSAGLGDDGPSRKSFAPKSSPRPKSAGPARAVRDNQAKLDRSARLGDSGPKSSRGGMGGMKKGFMDGGMTSTGYKKGGTVGCKTY